MTETTDSASAPPNRRHILLAAAAGAAAVPLLQSSASAQGGGAAAEPLLPQSFGAVGDGSRDDWQAIQNAVDQSLALGRPLHFPPGRYRIDRTISMRPGDYLSYAGAFAPGPRLIGAGSGRTIFEGGTSGPLFDLDSNSDQRDFRAVLGSVFEGFTISRGGIGLRLRSAFNASLRDLHIVGLGGTGLQIVCLNGDRDGSNMVNLEQVRIENCRGWGIDSAAAPGRNEISFLRLQHVFIQGCGTAGAGAIPQSGGMRWKGQICAIDQCAFAACENVGLFIPGEAGLGQSMDIQNTAFENNKRRHLFSTGISNLRSRNTQFYSNDQHRAQIGCEFLADRFTVRGVHIDGAVVRATPANRPFTAFKISGPHAELDNCSIRNVVWDNFGHPGQVRYQGWPGAA